MSTDWRPVRHLLRCSCRHGHPGSANYAPAFLGSSGATYAAIANRRGTKIATIAIARKLLTRAYHLLARWRGAGWVLARPLRPPRRGTTTTFPAPNAPKKMHVPMHVQILDNTAAQEHHS